MPNPKYLNKSPVEIFDMGRDAGQMNLNSKFAPDVFKYSLNYFVGDYQAVGFNQPFGNWQNEPDIAQDLANKQLYNGNIRAMYVQAPNVKNALHFYEYDALNRISHSFSYEKAKVNRWFSNNNITKRYQTDYDYDGAGNLSSLKRKDQNASTFDRFTYHYTTGTNKLEYISDLANSNLRTDDIDNQAPNNYSYDLNGRLVSDVHDGVTLIKWNKSDKVLEVHKPNGVLTIKYNALDQKVSQSTSRNDSIVTEYFVYDPSGNVLATYGDTIKIQNFNVVSRKFSLHQLTIYGSSRIGLIEVDSLLWKDGVSNVVVSNVYTQKLGLKRYELSNHLGNVQTVISDRKLIDSHSGGQITSWKADVISVSDYYPFGMKIEERSWSSDTYRFGFNGKDFFTDWNRQDYGFRIYDPRKCRFESVDPLKGTYPMLTPYQFASNIPTSGIDLDGKEYYNATYTYRLQKDGTAKLIKTDYKRIWSTKTSYGRNSITVSTLLPYGPKGMGVDFTLIMQDESGKEIHRQKAFQARGSLWDNGITAYLVDYGVYSGSSTIWSYSWNKDDKTFIKNKNKADYNIPPIDETDSPARIHDQEYEAVGSAGAKGLLDDFATIEADTKAMNKWYKDGSSQSMKQAHAFNLIIHRKMNGVRHFMIDTDQIDPKLTSQEAYLVFRANYMLKDVNGTWRKQEGKWDNNNKPIAPNK